MKRILGFLMVFCVVSAFADTLICTHKPATGDSIQAVHITTNATDVETIVNGRIDSGNIEDGTLTGADLASGIAITTSGSCTFSGTNTYSGASTFSAALTYDDGAGASPNVTFQDGSDETAVFSKTDAGFLTLTTVAGDGLNILTGNLQIGNGTPGNTLDGEDFYCEGEGEFDGGVSCGGAVEVTGAVTVTGATALNGGLALDTDKFTVDDTSGNTLIAGTLTVNGGTVTLGDAAGDAVTWNAAAWTLANDTTVALSGGVDGINFDSNTLSIDAANNRVGIGTAVPSYTLDVQGTMGLNGSLTVTDDDLIGLGTGKGYISFDDTTTDQLEIMNCNVGIGTQSPSAILEIVTGYQMLQFGTGTNTSGYRLDIGVNDDGVNFNVDTSSRGFNFKDSSNTLFSIAARTGAATFIGSASVGAALNVSGDFAVTGAGTVGGDLTVTGASTNFRTAIRAVDGAGSGVDADLLDGKGSDNQFGAWASATVGSSTLAATDGVLIMVQRAHAAFTFYTGPNNPPSTSPSCTFVVLSESSGDLIPATSPVRKGDYYLISVSAGTVVAYWLPIGS